MCLKKQKMLSLNPLLLKKKEIWCKKLPFLTFFVLLFKCNTLLFEKKCYLCREIICKLNLINVFEYEKILVIRCCRPYDGSVFYR